MKDKTIFPEIITKLPLADIELAGAVAHLFQGEEQQMIFMYSQEAKEVLEHKHEALWGVVLDGEIELKVEGKKNIYSKGDTFFIPENVPHSAKITAGYKDITFINKKDKFKKKIA